MLSFHYFFLFKMKSVQYWPDGDEGNYGDLCVSIKKEDIFADFTIRHMICTYVSFNLCC